MAQEELEQSQQNSQSQNQVDNTNQISGQSSDIDLLDMYVETGEHYGSILQRLPSGAPIKVNSDVNVYLQKYGATANPANPQAILDEDVVKLHSAVKSSLIAKEQMERIGYTNATFQAQDLYNRIATVHPKGYDFSAAMSAKLMQKDIRKTPDAYTGFKDLTTGQSDQLGTQEEIAWTSDYMYEEVKDANGKTTLKKAPKPSTIEGMQNSYEDKNVVTTMIDPANGRPVFVAKAMDSYVKRDDIYSFEDGPRQMYTNTMGADWFEVFGDRLKYGVQQSMATLGKVALDILHDDSYIFSQGQEGLSKYYQRVRKQLLEERNIREVEELDKAYESGDWVRLNDQFKRAEANIQDVSKAREISYYSKPETWVKFDKKYQAAFNKYESYMFNKSDEMNNTEGALGLWYQSAEVLADVVPQVALGMVTGGLSTLGTAGRIGTWATRGIQMSLEASQAMNYIYRDWEENNIDMEKRTQMAIPLMIAIGASNRLIGNWQHKLTGRVGLKESLKEFITPVTKTLANESTEKLAKGGALRIARDYIQKIATSKPVRNILTSDSPIVAMAFEVAEENIQEGLEQIAQNVTELYINKEAPIWAEVGKGKTATDEVFEGMGETFGATSMSTALISALTAGIPYAYRSAIGMPKKLQTDAQKRDAIIWAVLNGKADNLVSIAEQEYKKNINGKRSMWGNPNWKMSDAIMDGVAPTITAPKSKILERNGIMEGQVIDNLTTLRFVEFATMVEKYKGINDNQSLNQLDKTILKNMGFVGDLSSKRIITAYEGVYDAKQQLDNFTNNKPEGITDEQYTKQLETLQADYDKKQQDFLYYSQPEEGVGSGNSKFVNDTVKRNRTIKKQVDAIMNNDKRFIGKSQNELNKDDDYLEAYQKTWYEKIVKYYGYNNITEMRDKLVSLNEKKANADQQAIDDITNPGTLNETIDKEIDGINDLLSKTVDIKTGKELGIAIENLNNMLSVRIPNMNQENLINLANKYTTLMTSARNKMRGVVDEDFNTKVGPLNEQYDKAIKDIESATARITTLKGVDTTEMSDEERKAISDEILQLESTIEQNDASTVELEQKLAVINRDDSLDSFVSQIAEATDEDGSAIEGTINNDVLGNMLYHMDANTDEALQDKLDRAKAGIQFLEAFINDNSAILEELNDFYTSLENNDNSYSDKYKGRENITPGNASIIAERVLSNIDDILSFENAFDTASVMNGDELIEKHSSADENRFIKEIAGKKDEFKEKVAVLKNMAEELRKKSGLAEVAANKERYHTQTLLNESTINSLKYIASLELLYNGSTFLDMTLVKRITELQPLSDEIYASKGDYTESQIAVLNQREKLMNDFLTNLQENRAILFNSDNFSKLMDIFNVWRQQGDENNIFFNSDANAHANNGEAIINISRENIAKRGHFKEGKYFIAHPSHLQKDKGADVEKAEVIMAMRDLANVLSWVKSPYSINQIEEARSKQFNTAENIATAEQRMASNTLVSFLADEDNNLYQMMYDYLDSFNDNGNPHEYGKGNWSSDNSGIVIKDYMFNCLSISGDYGTGKTEFVLPEAFNILKALQGKDTAHYTFVSITDKLQQTHKRTFSNKYGAKQDYMLFDDMMQKLSIPNALSSSSDHVIIIDEASIISRKQFAEIKEWSRKNGNKVKIIFLGDTFQMRARSEDYPYVLITTPTTVTLTHQFSTTSNLIRNLANKAKQATLKVNQTENFYEIPVNEINNNGAMQGARYFKDKNEVVNAFINRIGINSNAALIFSSPEIMNAFMQAHPSLKEELEKHKDKIYFALTNNDGTTKNMMQGLREKEVFIALSYDDVNTEKEIHKQKTGEFSRINNQMMSAGFYTAIGRASNWVGLIGNTQLNNSKQAASVGIDITDSQSIKNIKQQTKEKEQQRLTMLGYTLDSKEEVKKTVATVQKKVERIYTIDEVVLDSNGREYLIKYQKKGIRKVNSNKIVDYNVFLTYEEDGKEKTDTQTVTIPYTDIDKISGLIKEQVQKIIDNSYGDPLNDLFGKQEGAEQQAAKIDKKNKKDKRNSTSKKDIPTATIKTSITTKDNSEVLHDEMVEVEANGNIIEGQIVEINDTTIDVFDGNRTIRVGNDKVLSRVNLEEEVALSGQRILTESAQVFDTIEGVSIHWISSATVVGAEQSDTNKESDGKSRAEKIRLRSGFVLNKVQSLGIPVYLGQPQEKNILVPNNQGKEEAVERKIMPIYIKITNDIKQKLVNEANNIDARFNNKQFINFNDLKNGELLYIGSMSEVNVPEFIGSSNNISHTKKVTTIKEINKAYKKLEADIKSRGITNIDLDIEKSKQMNIALLSIWDNVTTEQEVILSDIGTKTRIAYNKNANIPLDEFLNANDLLLLETKPVRDNSRLRIKALTVNGEVINMVVRNQRLDSKEGNSDLVAFKNTLEGIKKDIDNDVKVNQKNKSDNEVNDSIQRLFFNSAIGKLLRNNRVAIDSDEAIQTKNNISKYVNIRTGHYNLKGNTPKEIMGNLDSLIEYLQNEDTLLEGLYSFISTSSDGVYDIAGNELTEEEYRAKMVINATRVNNPSAYIEIDKPNSDLKDNAKVSKEQEINDNDYNVFEEVRQSSPQLQQIETAINELKELLGQNYIDSEYFLTRDGMIREDGKIGYGITSRNAYMTLASVDGMIPKSTARHEVFHVVYRNFIKDDVKGRLKEAAKTVAFREGHGDITGREEEWMAREFGSKKLYKGTDANTSLWNRFKNFMDKILANVFNIYRNRELLNSVYNDIDNGKYKNRVEDLKPSNTVETVFEVTETESSSPDNDIDEEQTANNPMLNEAYERANDISKNMHYQESIQKALDLLRFSFMQYSNYGNRVGGIQIGFQETLQEVYNRSLRISEAIGNKQLTLTDGSRLNISDIYEQGKINEIDYELSTSKSYTIESINKDLDAYYIYSDKDNVRTLLQKQMPSMNFDRGTTGQVGYQEGYGRETNDYRKDISVLQKMYLSSIPRINAIGQVVRTKGSVLIDERVVMDKLKELGEKVNTKSGNKIDGIKSIMEKMIDKGRINPKTNEYYDDTTSVIHSIYNVLFGARGHNSISNYSLDYSLLLGTGEYIGLQEHINNRIKALNSVIARNSNNIPILNVSDYGNIKMIEDAQQFLNSIVNQFTSLRTREIVKMTYNRIGKDEFSLSMITFNPNKWRDVSKNIQDYQQRQVRKGMLSDSFRGRFNNNVSINGANIMLLNPTTKEMSYGLKYNTIKKVYSFSIDGTARTIPFTSRDKNFTTKVKQITNIKSILGLQSMTSKTVEAILTARNWDEVSDEITRIGTDNAWYENYFTDIVSNYKTPIEWFADLLGNTLVLYDAYSKNYSTTYEVKEGKNKVSKTKTGLSLHEFLNYNDDRNINDKLKEIPGYEQLKGFINRTVAKSMQITSASEDMVTTDDISNMGAIGNYYYGASHMFTSYDMLSTIIEKSENLKSNKMVYNAEGKMTTSEQNKSSFSEAIENGKIVIDSEGIKIKGLVTSVGLSNDIGVKKIGINKIGIADYIATSTEIFFKNVIKSGRFTEFYVPTIPQGDKGNVNYAKVESSIINYDGLLSINYKNLARELTNMKVKHDKYIDGARNRFEAFISSVNELAGKQIINPLNIKDSQRYSLTSLEVIEDKLNAWISLDPMNYEIVKLAISDNKLWVNINTNKPHNDIGYNNGKVYIGSLVKDTVKGMDIYSDNTEAGILLQDAITAFEKGDNETGMSKLLNRSVFGNDIFAIASRLKNSGYTTNKDHAKLNNLVKDTKHTDNYYEYRVNKDGTIDKRRVLDKVNIPLFAQMLVTKLTNDNIGFATGLNSYTVGSFAKSVKINGPYNTPSIGLLTNTYNNDGVREITLPNESYFIPVDNIIINAGNTFQRDNDGNTFFGDNDNEKDVEDGQMYANPFYRILMRNSFGGETNTILGKSDMYKTITNQTNSDGSFMQLKRAEKALSTDDMQHKLHRDRLMLMLRASDYRLQLEQITDFSFEQAFKERFNANPNVDINDIAKEILQQQYMTQYYADGTINPNAVKRFELILKSIVSHIVPESVNKGVVKGINSNTNVTSLPIDGVYVDRYSNDDTRVILNPAQETNDNKMQQAPMQIETMLAVAPTKALKTLGKEYHATKRALQEALIEQFNDEISQTKINGNDVSAANRFNKVKWDKDINTLTANERKSLYIGLNQLDIYLRSINIKALQENNQDLAYIDLMNDTDISRQLPMMRHKLKQSYLSQLNKRLQARHHGIRLTQTSGYGIELYRKGGVSYELKDALKLIGQYTINFDDMSNGTYDAILSEQGFEKHGLDDMMIDEKGNTIPGMMIMPNILADKYGHRPEDTMLDIITVKIGGNYIHFNEDGNYNLISRISHNKFMGVLEEGRKNGNEQDIIDDFIDSPMIRKAITNLIEDKVINADVDIAQQLNSRDIYDKIIVEASILAETFEVSLEQFISRVPANFMGAGSVLKSVAFHNNSGNIVYVPVGMTLRNDSDFDIDALTDYIDSINSKGKRDETKAGKLRNKLNDMRKQIIMDKDMQRGIFIRSSAIEIDNKDVEGNANSLTKIYDSFEINKAGADGIGIIANSLNAYAYILSTLDSFKSGPNSLLKQIITNETINGVNIVDVDNIINRIGKWEQTALDNKKNNTFGAFGLSKNTINLLTVLVGMGRNEDQIYEFFTNPYISELLAQYNQTEKVVTSKSDFDLYTMAVQRINNLQYDFNNINDKAIIEAFNRVNNTTFKTLSEAGITFANAMESEGLIRNNIELIDEAINGIIAEHLSQQKIGKDKVSEDRIASFRDNNRISRVAITDAKFRKNNTTIDDIKKMELSDELASQMVITLNAIANLSELNDILQAKKILSELPSIIVTAEALFRTSYMISKRAGLEVVDGKINEEINNIQNMFNMPLDKFINNEIPEQLNIEEQIQYFINNNPNYNAIKNSRKLTDSEKQRKMDIMIEKERRILNEVNLPYLIKGIPQVNKVIEELSKNVQLAKNMYISDKVYDALIPELNTLQNFTQVRYTDQHAIVMKAVSNLLLDTYFSGSQHSSIGTMSLPYQSTTGYATMAFDRTLNLANMYERNEFVVGFNEYVQSMLDNIDNVEFLRLMVPDAQRDYSFDKLQSNLFLNSITFGGVGDKVIKLNTNTRNMTQMDIARYKDSFEQLPEYIKNLFIYNEIISNQMNYKEGGVMQLIGVDFYKDEISAIYEDMYKAISEKGINELAYGNMTFDDIKEGVYDYIGMSTEFAQYLPSNEFMENNEDGPTYVYNYTQNGSFRNVQYYKKINGLYTPMYKIARFGGVSTKGLSTATNIKVFTPSQTELDAIKQGYIANHRGTSQWATRGEVLMLSSGLEADGLPYIVEVIDIDGVNFTYRNIHTGEKTKLEYINERIANQLMYMNNRVSIQGNELLNRLLSPNKVDTDINFNKDNAVLVLKDLKGNPIFVMGDKFESINDVLDRLRRQAYRSINGNEDNFTQDRYNISYWSKVEGGLRKKLNSKSTPQLIKNDISRALALVDYGAMVVVNDIIRQRIEAEQTVNPELMDEMKRLLYNNEINATKLFDAKYENWQVGTKTYGMMLRDAINNIAFNDIKGIKKDIKAEASALSNKKILDQLFAKSYEEGRILRDKDIIEKAKANEQEYSKTKVNQVKNDDSNIEEVKRKCKTK